MAPDKDGPLLNILHVLTLNGRNGEYGGPVRVARELCLELNKRGHMTKIFSGALHGSEPAPNLEIDESYILVKSITKKFPTSSLWSWKLIRPLTNLVKNSDVVHIHFARDLISFITALISIIYRKQFITQTHGMIISDMRLSTRVIDLFLTRPLINRSKTNFVLTNFELSAIKTLRINSPSTVLPNGIAVNQGIKLNLRSKNRIVFCSRLDKRKGIEKFIELAALFKNENIKFDIYGPDGGELTFIESEIKKKNLITVLEYKGAIPAEQVHNVLSQCSLLVLPSKDEPFPMVVLEAMAMGTPVLVMPSCGFAQSLKAFEPSFVAASEDIKGLIESFNLQYNKHFNNKLEKEIINFCDKTFGISAVVDSLFLTYTRVICDDK